MLQNKLLIIVFLKLIRRFLPQIICGNSDIDCNTLMNVGIIEINLFPCRIDDIRFSSIGVLVTIEVKLPKEVYDSASEILAKQGLTMEDALILFLKETVRLGRIPFDYTEEDLEEARRWERIVNDDVQDTGGEETCMVN